VAAAGAAIADIPVPTAAAVDAGDGDPLAANPRKKPGSMRVRP
jgi:hypothetical protein